MALRILLADDHQIVRESFRALLEADPAFEVVADVGDGDAAVKAALALKPDVIIMDMTMPILDGTAATRRIMHELPSTRILAMSMHSHHQFITAMLSAGATGYVFKSCQAKELIAAIRMVAAGKTYFPPGLKLPTPTFSTSARPAMPAASRLSDREREVLKLIGDGYETSEIADRLKLSDKTIATHREHIMNKLGIPTIAGLTKYAIREGLCTV